MNKFVCLLNNHRIRGPCKSIPEELSRNSRLALLNETDIPEIDQLIQEYNFDEGSINSDLSDAEVFSNIIANNVFKKYIDSIDFDLIYRQILNNNREIILEVLTESLDVIDKLDNRF